MMQESYTVVVAVNDSTVLQRNLFLSPGVKHDNVQLLIKRDCPSAALAYNAAIDESKNDIIIFVHQDVYFPDGWFASFQQSLSYLEKEQINWGVLGCFGSARNRPGGVGLVCTNGMGVHGNQIQHPEPVETLDEIVLIIRKSSGLRFDPSLPHFHLYGTDICMLAKEKGMAAYVMPAFCVHNTNQLLTLPKEFYKCYHHVKKHWRRYLPICTSCITISRWGSEYYQRKILEFISNLLGKSRHPARRVEDPRSLLKQA